MGFQQQVYAGMAEGIAGMRCSQNPVTIHSRQAEAALTVGNFAFVGTDTANQVKNAGRTKALGLVVRNEQSQITTWGAEYTTTINAGQTADIAFEGEFFVSGTGISTFNQAVFASFIDGSITFGTSGSVPADAVGTAHQSTTTMTVDTLSSGELLVGQHVTGNGFDGYILEQLTGTEGGTGTYRMSQSATIGTALAPVAFNGASSVETKYRVLEGGASLALIKVSTYL
jgi:hypothetical protein